MKWQVAAALVVTTGQIGLAYADPVDATAGGSRPGAEVQLTVNPEARVSAALTGRRPAPVACGTAAILHVGIVNQASVTATLEAHLSADTPASVTLDFHPRPLTGKSEERRDLYLTLTQPTLTDVTIIFQARREPPNLGGHDRIHFLTRCLSIATGPAPSRSLERGAPDDAPSAAGG